MKEPVAIIETTRLILRSPLPSDLPILHEHIFSDVSVMRHAFRGRPLSFQETTDFFDEGFDRHASGKKLGVIVERRTTEVIGIAGLLSCRALGKADYEIGFILRRSTWGKGYATEIGAGQLDFGFSSLGCRRLLALVAPQNTASIAVIKKLGMEFLTSVENDERGIRQIYVVHNDRQHCDRPSV